MVLLTVDSAMMVMMGMGVQSCAEVQKLVGGVRGSWPWPWVGTWWQNWSSTVQCGTKQEILGSGSWAVRAGDQQQRVKSQLQSQSQKPQPKASRRKPVKSQLKASQSQLKANCRAD
jgi:hypothetical protein